MRKFIERYPFLILIFTPVLVPFLTPIVSIPGTIIAFILFGHLCKGLGELCMAGPGIATIFVIDAIAAYIIGLKIYKSVVKPTNKQLVIAAVFLLLYFYLVFKVLAL